MIRKAFKMRVYPDFIEEYIKRHNPIWKELKMVLKKHGVYSYSIFLDMQSSTLFAYVEIESEEKWDAIAMTEVCKKWWAYMADLMETNQDNSPVSLALDEVFFMV